MPLKKQLVVSYGLLLALVVAVGVDFSYTTGQLMQCHDLISLATTQHGRLQTLETTLTRWPALWHDMVSREDVNSIANLESAYAGSKRLLRDLLATAEQEVDSLPAGAERNAQEQARQVYARTLESMTQRGERFALIADESTKGRRANMRRAIKDFGDLGIEAQLLEEVRKSIAFEDQSIFERTQELEMVRVSARMLGLFAVSSIAFCIVVSVGVLLISLRKIQHGEAERLALHRDLVSSAHSAGMSEIATGVQHNVGNVLNSVNASASLLGSLVKNSITVSLQPVLKLAAAQGDQLAEFAKHDPRGEMLPKYFGEVADALEREREQVLEESRRLEERVNYIKSVIRVQQNYARGSVFEEMVTVPDLIQDAITLCDRSLQRRDIRVVKEIRTDQPLRLAKSKLLQVLVNLIKNAKEAIVERGGEERLITIDAESDDECLTISVSDTGIGIEPEMMDRIFGHGFTTKAEGNGFGLHSCAIAIQEMGGAISVQSDGVGRGATFTIRLPVKYALAEPAETLACALPEGTSSNTC